MNKHINCPSKSSKVAIITLLLFTGLGCKQEFEKIQKPATTKSELTKSETPEYFLLRPKLEKMYGYTQAVRIGNIVKIGGVISIDDEGNPTAKADFMQQMKNCYASLDKILKHYGCTFDNVILENLYTTSMTELHKNASYRQEIYKNHFPTGSWIGIKELGLSEMMIEIEIEALISKEK